SEASYRNVTRVAEVFITGGRVKLGGSPQVIGSVVTKDVSLWPNQSDSTISIRAKSRRAAKLQFRSSACKGRRYLANAAENDEALGRVVDIGTRFEQPHIQIADPSVVHGNRKRHARNRVRQSGNIKSHVQR